MARFPSQPRTPATLLMDSAYEDDQTRQLALDFGWIPVVPPKHTRLEPVEQDWAVVWTCGLLTRIFNLMFDIPTFQRPSASLFIGARAR